MKQWVRWGVAATAVALVVPTTAAFAGGGGAGADIQISGSASTGSPTAGTPFSYTFQAKDSGPDSAAATVFSDTLPAGMGFRSATVNGVAGPCTTAPDSAGKTVVSCSLGTLANGTQATVVVDVTAPSTAGSYSNTGTATSSTPDPQPANNAVTVTVKVATCSFSAGQTVLNGMVMWKDTNSSGMFENFEFSAGRVNYYVITNFYDGTRPLTTVINLNCKQVPNSFIQTGNTVTVTVAGTVGTAVLPGSTTETPVIDASTVQVPYLFDKI